MSKPYPMVPGLFGEDVPLIPPKPGAEPDTRKVFMVCITEERTQRMYVLGEDEEQAEEIARKRMNAYDFEADDPDYSASEADSGYLKRIPKAELVTADRDEGLTVGDWLGGAQDATQA